MRYTELHCKTNFSFLEGASHASELAERTAELGYSALAVTDRNTLAGMVRAHAATKAAGLKLIVGAEITPVDAPPVVLWASNRKGYGCLCRLITVGRQRAKKGQCELTFADVAEHSEGLLAGISISKSPCGTTAYGLGRQPQGNNQTSQLSPEGATDGERSSFCRPVGASGRVGDQVPGADAPGYTLPPLRGYQDAHSTRGSEVLSREATLANSPSLQAGKINGKMFPSPEGGDASDNASMSSPPSGLQSSDLSFPWAEAQGYLPESLRDSSCDGNSAGSRRAPCIGRTERSPTPATHSPLPYLANYRDVFGDRCYLLVELHNGPDDERLLNEYIRLSREAHVPLVAAGDVHFHVPARLPLQHVMTCIRHGVTLSEAGSVLFPNAERCLQPLDVIEAKFALIPDAVERTQEIADRCNFDMGKLRYEYPLELSPDGVAPIEYLKQLTWEGAKQRYRNTEPTALAAGGVQNNDGEQEGPEASAYGSPEEGQSVVPEKVRELINRELKLIEELRYEAFFLTVYDAVKFARERNILCQGRGSAANSAVCYCLGITSVDPNQMELLFERFISKERNEEPDIDVDFEHERREEVLQYLYEKYGRDRAGIAATVVRYRRRSAVRDVGKALGLSLDTVDALAKNAERHSSEAGGLQQVCSEAGVDSNSGIGKRFIHLAEELMGFPRHLSQHVGGMVITQGPLCELVPIENAAMEGRTVVEWDKEDLEELGILKVDCLCLGMLTAIRKCFELIEQQTGKRWTLATIPEDDSAVYDMVCDSDVIGCFQIESRAQMSMLPRLKPRCYYDLVVEVSIVRPGPIQGNMVHPYLDARASGKPSYPNDEIRELLSGVLDKTMGVPIFQEQVMQLAMKAADFTAGEADQLRRAMGAWARKGDMCSFRDQLMEGMRKKGFPPKFADQIFEMIKGFGDYGFPESHAASFALLAYASAWLKHHYQAAFTAALLNSQPMGFYAPSQLIQDARRHKVQVLPIDINHSDWDCTLDDLNTIRLGFRLAKGMRRQDVETIMRCRIDGRFTSMDDFVARTNLTRAVVVKLTEADTFGSLAASRREAYWSALSQEESRRAMPLFDAIDYEESTAALPERPQWEEVCDDYNTTGLTLREHPMSFMREQLKKKRAIRACDLEELPADQLVQIAGVITGRQRPFTAKGVVFATLEDETGFANLVLFQHVWERYAKVLRHSNFWLVTGKVQQEGKVIHVVVQRVVDYQPQVEGLRAKSRDFQ